MPMIWFDGFSSFYCRATSIWIHSNALERKFDSVEFRTLVDIANLPHDTFKLPGMSPNFYELAWQSAIQNLLEKMPVSIEERTVRPFLVSSLSFQDHFFMVYQVYLALQIRDLIETLSDVHVNKDANDYHSARWRLNKSMNMLIHVYLPGVPEENTENILKVLQVLYGHSFTLGVQPVITNQSLQDTASSIFSMMEILLKGDVKNASKELSFRQSQFLSLIRSQCDVMVKMLLLVDMLIDFKLFLGDT